MRLRQVAAAAAVWPLAALRRAGHGGGARDRGVGWRQRVARVGIVRRSRLRDSEWRRQNGGVDPSATTLGQAPGRLRSPCQFWLRGKTGQRGDGHADGHLACRRRYRRVEPARLPVAARDLRGGKRQPKPGALRRNARRRTRGAKRDHAARADLDEGVGGDLDGPALLQNPRSQQRRCGTLGERGLDRLDGSARG